MRAIKTMEDILRIKKGDILNFNTTHVQWDSYPSIEVMNGQADYAYEVIEVAKPERGDLKSHIITLRLQLSDSKVEEYINQEYTVKASNLLDGNWHVK